MPAAQWAGTPTHSHNFREHTMTASALPNTPHRPFKLQPMPCFDTDPSYEIFRQSRRLSWIQGVVRARLTRMRPPLYVPSCRSAKHGDLFNPSGRRSRQAFPPSPALLLPIIRLPSQHGEERNQQNNIHLGLPNRKSSRPVPPQAEQSSRYSARATSAASSRKRKQRTENGNSHAAASRTSSAKTGRKTWAPNKCMLECQQQGGKQKLPAPFQLQRHKRGKNVKPPAMPENQKYAFFLKQLNIFPAKNNSKGI